MLSELSGLVAQLEEDLSQPDDVETILKRLVQLCDSDHRENRSMFVSVGVPNVFVRVFVQLKDSPKCILLALKVLR